MKKAIFVDAALVTTPSEDESKEAVEAWLKILQMWLQEALYGHFQWLHCVQASNLLTVYGRFPNFDVLRSWSRKYNLDINPALLARDVNTFFRDETLDLQSCLEVLEYDAEIEPGSVHIRPEAIAQRWLDYIQPEMRQLLVTACAYKYLGSEFVQYLHMVTPALIDPAREIEISAIMIDSLPSLPRELDQRISQTLPLLFTPDDLLPLIDVVSLWYEGEQGIIYAIEQQFKKTWQQTGIEPMPFRLGPRFIESANNANLDTNIVVLEKIIRIAAAIIADKAMEVKCNLRHLRMSKTADSPQRVRSDDGAKAWRLTLTDQGVGWRMHYWRIPGEKNAIEFASVLKKSDPEEIY
jgi:hypothetical protein